MSSLRCLFRHTVVANFGRLTFRLTFSADSSRKQSFPARTHGAANAPVLFDLRKRQHPPFEADDIRLNAVTQQLIRHSNNGQLIDG